MSSHNDDQNFSSVRNEELIPPGSARAREVSGKRYMLLVAASFLVVLSGLIGVLFFLPGEDAIERSSGPEAVVQSEQPEAIEPDPPLDSSRPVAVAARESFLALQIEAESGNISRWGGDEYRAVDETFAEGDALFQDENFTAASEIYQRTSAMLQTLIDSQEQRLRSAVQAGQDFLENRQFAEARDRFNQALAIEPADEEARDGLKRADSAMAAQVYYQEALTLEENNRLEEAVARLKLALELDGSHETAAKRLQSLEIRIGESIFSAEMNVLLSALDRQDFATANRSLKTLKSLGIRSEQVEQAETLIAEKQTQVLIEQLRVQASAFEDSEQWQQALEWYDRILTIVPDALFAVTGKKQAERRVQLQRALDEAIGRPERLQEHEQRSAGRQLLDYAVQIDPRGPELAARINALETLITAAEAPVPVTLESDNQTDVVIYPVARVGAFLSHRLSLLPGTYTVVGSRTGYRDVRKQVTIEAGDTAYRIDIRCEEPI